MKESSEGMGWDGRMTTRSRKGLRKVGGQKCRSTRGRERERAADGAGDRRREGAEDGQSLTVRGGGAEGEEATPQKEKAE